MAEVTTRIQDLANKIGQGTDVLPHQIDASAVKNAADSGSIEAGDADEFMKFLAELGVEGNVDGDNEDGVDLDEDED
jgi:hypothetical protein